MAIHYMAILGRMIDKVTFRYLLVDEDGRAEVKLPNIKQVQVTKALIATGSSYSANDVLSESLLAGTSWRFPGLARIMGGSGYITKAVVQCQAEAQTDRLTMFLFNRPPTGCNLNDNVANTAPDIADVASYQGVIDWSALSTIGTTDSVSIVTPSTTGNLPVAFTCAEGDDSLYGVLVSRDGNTLTAGESVYVTLTVEQN